MDSKLGIYLKEWLVNLGLSEDVSILINTLIFLIAIILLAFLVDIVTKKIIISLIGRLVRKTKTKWDDIFFERKVFNRLAHIAPALIIFYTIGYAFIDFHPNYTSIVQGGAKIYMLLIGLLVTDSFINALHQIYCTLPISKNRPIKGYVQGVKIIIYFLGIILILSILINKSPKVLLTGVGALAAVLLFVFKDTILGLVASIQLSANDMVKSGDWIEMPNYNADGTVTEISLHTVKVQNWDKTISTIPTYALVSEAFNNWRGMEESGGRRIKRSINIDMKSIKFCTKEMIEKYKKIHVLKDYIKKKEVELSEYNKENKIDESILVNGRRLTNIGTFRKYVEEYLKKHPKIHNDMTFLIRHLQSTEKGLPIEIYVFSNDQVWANYEAIQADIFDHILSVIPEFELNVFQNPTGEDFQKLRP